MMASLALPTNTTFAQREQDGIALDERELVIVFVTRYTTWCARVRHFEQLRNGVDLLVGVAAE